MVGQGRLSTARHGQRSGTRIPRRIARLVALFSPFIHPCPRGLRTGPLSGGRAIDRPVVIRSATNGGHGHDAASLASFRPRCLGRAG